MAATLPLLQFEHVSRQLGGREVLRDVSFTLQRGEVLGLLGVNGAGKSTTLAVIAGGLRPDAGRVRIDGRDVTDDPRASSSRIGWVPENVPLWPELTVSEALDACGRLRGLPRGARRAAVERELARLELTEIACRRCSQLSLGQKRRVGLGQALLHEPDLLVLDEPGNGLDPVQAMQLRALIGDLASSRGIILTSHVLAEVEAMCARVVILHEGAVRHDAKLDGLRGSLDAQFRAIACAPAGAAAGVAGAAGVEPDRLRARGRRRMTAFAIARLDLKRLAVRPFAWTLAGIALAMMAWQFLLGLSAFLHAQPTIPGATAALGFTDSVVGPYLLNYLQLCLVIAPLITMQALAGERGAQRLALLGAAGASGFQIVVGKFLARLAFLWLLLVVVATMPLVLAHATTLDWGQFGAALIATALCVAALTAIGIACSAFTPEPALAAAAALLIGEALSLIDAGVRLTGGGTGWLGYLALHTHLAPALRGLVRSEDLIYFLLIIALALALATRRVGAERERG